MQNLLNKNGVILLLTLAIVIISILSMRSCQTKNVIKQEYENTITALNDSLKKSVNKAGDTVYIERAAEMTPKDIMNSALYKTLDKKTQDYIKELAATKGLLASANATIETKDKEIKKYQYAAGVKQTDTTVTFTKGDSIVYDKKNNNLDLRIKAVFKDSITWNFNYKYKANITTTWTREKDKSIKIEYKLDDPKASMINGKAFYIPADSKPKWKKNLETAIKIIVPTAAFIGGTYVGIKLVK